MKNIYNLEFKVFRKDGERYSHDTLYSSKKKALEVLKAKLKLYTVSHTDEPVTDDYLTDTYFLEPRKDEDRFYTVRIVKVALY